MKKYCYALQRIFISCIKLLSEVIFLKAMIGIPISYATQFRLQTTEHLILVFIKMKIYF